MRETLESFGAMILKTGGLGLLVLYPLIPAIILYAGLQAVGRSLWSAGTRRKDRRLAEQILSAPRSPGDEFYRDMAKDILRRQS